LITLGTGQSLHLPAIEDQAVELIQLVGIEEPWEQCWVVQRMAMLMQLHIKPETTE